MADPREPRRREARGDLLGALVLADPLGSLLPHVDPSRELGQAGARGDAQRGPGVATGGLSRLASESRDHLGPLGEQVAVAVRDLA